MVSHCILEIELTQMFLSLRDAQFIDIDGFLYSIAKTCWFDKQMYLIIPENWGHLKIFLLSTNEGNIRSEQFG